MKDGRILLGSFECFKDYGQLREKCQYRFVPIEQNKEFTEAFTIVGEANPHYSVIINCDDIVSLDFI